ncbi:MAG: hypothetical protein LBD90_06520, partial [Bifidobacteriaceae bacterium]|nr:hypothetical protein [Bifidobacteriaceae bacterium]
PPRLRFGPDAGSTMTRLKSPPAPAAAQADQPTPGRTMTRLKPPPVPTAAQPGQPPPAQAREFVP